jgi:hypothetical protein
MVPLSISKIHFPVIGRYSKKNFTILSDLNCNISINAILTKARAKLKLKLVVGICIYANMASMSVNMTLMRSTVYHSIFATNITKNSVTIYIFMLLFSFLPNISSKNSYIASKSSVNVIPTFVLGNARTNHTIAARMSNCTNTQIIIGESSCIGVHRDCATNTIAVGICFVKKCMIVSIMSRIFLN